MNCSRGPQQVLLSWLYNSPRQAGGQQQQTIKHSLSKTITNSLGFENDNLVNNDWMNKAKNDKKEWAQRES